MKIQENRKDFRVVILGEKNSGKSALTVRYLTGRYINEYSSGSNIAYSHKTEVNTESIVLQILDSSADKYSQAALAWADGVIVVYSIDSRKSFRKAKALLEEVKSINNLNAAVSLVGNKADLWSHRTVLKYEGETLARQKNCHHYEVSAATDYNPVKRIFNMLTRKMLEQRDKTDKRITRTPTMFRKLLHKYEKRDSFK